MMVMVSQVCTYVKAYQMVQFKYVLFNVYQLYFNKTDFGASLVAQWLRICLPMQGTRVRALIREDPTCRGATKPVHHNC